MSNTMDRPSRRAAARREQRQQPRQGRSAPPARRNNLPWIITAVVVLAILGFVLFRALQRESAGNIEGLVVFPAPAREHTTAPQTYAEQPPVGGVHWASWQNCGVYSAPIQNEYGVHSMEHGAVWITYNPDLPADQIAALQQIAQQRAYVVMSPYPGLSSPIALSAWGLQLKVDNVSDERINQFIAAYEQGPQTPEPGAACSGGISTPAGS